MGNVHRSGNFCNFNFSLVGSEEVSKVFFKGKMHVKGEFFYGILNLGLVKGQVKRQLGRQQRLRSLSTRSASIRQLRWWMEGTWLKLRLPIPIF